MSFLTRFRFGVARAALKSTTLQIVPTWLKTSFLEPAFHMLVSEGYQKNGAFFACVSALAFGFSEPPLQVFDGPEQDATRIPTHPFIAFMQRPNQVGMGQAELMITTIVYMAIGGNAYWHKIRNARGQVIEVRPYHAGHITAIPGGDYWIDHYVYDVQGLGGTGAQLPRIPREDLVHFKWPSPDPRQPWQAQPPLLAAATNIQSDNELTKYLFALLRNDAVPRTVLVTPADRVLDDPEARRMKQQWKERYGGENRGDVAILEGGTTVQRLGLNMTELAFDALHRIPETRIAAVMRVPPIIAGLAAGLERSTFANYGEARAAFTQDTLSPLWRMVESEIDADLLPEFGNGVTVRFDRDQVAALQEDRAVKWGYITTAYKSGLIQLNEGRRKLGFIDVPEGDAFYSAPSMGSFTELPADESDEGVKLRFLLSALSELGASGRKTDRRGPALVLPSPQTKAISLPRIEQIATTALIAYLKNQYDQAAEEMREQDTPDIDGLGLDTGDILFSLLSQYLWSKVLRQGFADGAAELEDVGIEIDLVFDLDNPEVQKVLTQLAKSVRDITTTTRDDIQALVGKHAAEGWTIDQLADEIAKLDGIHSRNRARTIARTETTTAYSKGSILAWQQAGEVKEMEWSTAADEMVCPECSGLDGKRVMLGGNFPGGVAHPPAHPNCRCALIPIVE